MKLILQLVCWFLSLAGTSVHFPVLPKQLKIEGFVVYSWYNRREEGLKALLKWVVEVRKEGVVFCKVYSHHSFPLCKESLVVAVELRSQRNISLPPDLLFEPFGDTDALVNMPDPFCFAENCNIRL